VTFLRFNSALSVPLTQFAHSFSVFQRYSLRAGTARALRHTCCSQRLCAAAAIPISAKTNGYDATILIGECISLNLSGLLIRLLSTGKFELRHYPPDWHFPPRFERRIGKRDVVLPTSPADVSRFETDLIEKPPDLVRDVPPVNER
jgi:hypothetical protein